MRSFSRLLLVFAIGLAIAVAMLFTNANAEPVAVDLLLGRLEFPLWALLFGAFLLGALGACIGLLPPLARRTLRARHYRRAVRELESEVHQLRNLPLEGADAVPGVSERGA